VLEVGLMREVEDDKVEDEIKSGGSHYKILFCSFI
jgi:hypothetical protein